MQILLGKILAGEVSRPGKYHVRTLKILLELTRHEIHIFQKARYLALDNGAIIFSQRIGLEQFGLTYDDIVILRDAGLMRENDNMALTFTFDEGPLEERHGYNGQEIIFRGIKDKSVIEVQQILFTTAAKELMQLIQPSPNLHYLKFIASKYQGLGLEILLGDIGADISRFKIIDTNIS